MSEVSDTLRKALALIEKPENWCQNEYDKDGAFCLFGAISVANASDPGMPWDSRAFNAVRRILIHRHGHIGSLEHFNDHPDTTHPMVVDLFKRAIAEEEANV